MQKPVKTASLTPKNALLAACVMLRAQEARVEYNAPRENLSGEIFFHFAAGQSVEIFISPCGGYIENMCLFWRHGSGATYAAAEFLQQECDVDTVAMFEDTLAGNRLRIDVGEIESSELSLDDPSLRADVYIAVLLEMFKHIMTAEVNAEQVLTEARSVMPALIQA